MSGHHRYSISIRGATYQRSILTCSSATHDAPVASIIDTTVPVGVSPRMAELITDYKLLTAGTEAVDSAQYFDIWVDADAAAARAMTALTNEQPVTMVDFLAKFTALAEVIEDDTEFYMLRRLVKDAHVLMDAAMGISSPVTVKNGGSDDTRGRRIVWMRGRP